jgi:hypothetical protein
MANIESLIRDSQKLTDIFGYWPSFHDAEVLEVNLWRGNIDQQEGLYLFPVLTLKMHVWKLTNEVDSKGYLVLQHHTLTTLKFLMSKIFKCKGLISKMPFLDCPS